MSRTPSSGVTSGTSISSSLELAGYHKIISELVAVTIQYDGHDRLCQQLGDVPIGTPLAKVKGISLDNFKKWNVHRETHRMWRLFFYSTETETLVVKFPSTPHEDLHVRIYDELVIASVANGSRSHSKGYGSTTYFMRKTGRMTAAGEGDSSFGPIPATHNDRFPTVIIEAGWTQTSPAIHAKMHWWFDVSDGAVKIVLLAIASVSHRQITVEKWKLGVANPRPGATTTRSSSSMVPILHQILIITRTPGTSNNNPASFQVTGTPLRLEFEDVFLRAPVATQTNLLLNGAYFQEYASLVWDSYDGDIAA
ncbi:hypothetical protein QQZ08_002407 [Neonectria magnoliae]|uniref:Uncharacterized protein n=1 Tax=Neonectria magnoliae TaxID=2732573 RepID=A0ABR1IC47_9HYPO